MRGMVDPVEAINFLLERLDRIIVALERIAASLERMEKDNASS